MATPDELAVTARLAGLRLTGAELNRLAHELNDILSHVDELRQVDLTAVAPFRHEATSPALRPDLPGADRLDIPPSYLAPEWRGGFFTVPRLPTHGDRE